jgi:hypothetical protein
MHFKLGASTQSIRTTLQDPHEAKAFLILINGGMLSATVNISAVIVLQFSCGDVSKWAQQRTTAGQSRRGTCLDLPDSRHYC